MISYKPSRVDLSVILFFLLSPPLFPLLTPELSSHLLFSAPLRHLVLSPPPMFIFSHVTPLVRMPTHEAPPVRRLCRSPLSPRRFSFSQGIRPFLPSSRHSSPFVLEHLWSVRSPRRPQAIRNTPAAVATA